MKKTVVLFLLFLIASLPVVAQQDSVMVKGKHPFRDRENVAKNESHWSLIPHIGFNVFDGDFHSEMNHPIGLPSAGLGMEYSFTPVWALGIEYMFDLYNVTGKAGADNAATLLAGHVHKPAVYVSMDFINLFFPHIERKIFSAQASVGVGYAWYRNRIMYGDETRYHTASFEPASMSSYAGLPFIQAGLNLEFNINRTIALGLRGTYAYFTKDFVDGRGYSGDPSIASKNNDGIADITLNLRIKFNSVKKTHARNEGGDGNGEYIEEVAEKAATKAVAEAIAPYMVHDTVIIHRHDSVIYREVATVEGSLSQYYYVYFPNNSSDLDEKGLFTVQQVADRMNDDEELYAVVTGFCDNTGPDNINFILGDKRAANVIDELRYEYGVPVNHLYAMGLGKVVGRGKQAAAYGPNRRAQIRLVDKETFERLKADLYEKKEMRIADFQTIPLSESARKNEVNEYIKRPSEKVTTDKNTTLAKLARKYYNNTYCWVYIYLANVNRIENPNALIEGSQLVIPELTQEELKITKDESLVLYGMSRHMK